MPPRSRSCMQSLGRLSELMAAGAAAARPPISSALSHPRTGHVGNAAPPQQKTPSTDGHGSGNTLRALPAAT
eukprot:4261361-Prymnesium_polylepis.1